MGVVWYYMGLYLYKSGGKCGKMGVFCGFLVAFLCGSGWSSGKFGRGGGCKEVILWGYGSIYINFLSWKE